MKRAKGTPRRTGEDGITQEFLTWTFGTDSVSYKLIWNGHCHFAVNEKTGEKFYINKNKKTLIPIFDFHEYRNSKQRQKPGFNGKGLMPTICISERKTCPTQLTVGQKYFIDYMSIHMDNDGDAYGQVIDSQGYNIGRMLLNHFQTI